MKRGALIVAAVVFAAALAHASGAEEEDSLDLSGVEVIVVRSGPLDVRVSGRGGAEVSFDDLHSRASRDPLAEFLADNGFPDGRSESRIAHKREGARLSVWLENDGLSSAPASGQISLRAPRDIELIVETGSGKVLVDRLEGRKCSVRTVSGRVRLYHVRGRISAESVSGSIDLDSTEGGIKARSVSGSITGRGLRLTDESSFSTVSGSVDVELDSALDDLSFDLHSVSGSITVGGIRAERGLKMGFGRTRVKGNTVSGSLLFE